MTFSALLCESCVMMFSAMQSEKYSWSMSPLMLVNASTVMEGGTEREARLPAPSCRESRRDRRGVAAWTSRSTAKPSRATCVPLEGTGNKAWRCQIRVMATTATPIAIDSTRTSTPADQRWRRYRGGAASPRTVCATHSSGTKPVRDSNAANHPVDGVLPSLPMGDNRQLQASTARRAASLTRAQT